MAEIIVYSSNMCGACEMVKEFLRLRGKEFFERNVSVDMQGREELLELGFDATPVTVIGDSVVEGFDVDKIDAALALAGQ
jgi:glutaredoxin